MSVQKIDYEDKIGLQNDPNVPDKNKVLDEDMNEIKSVVNNNADELITAQQNIENLQTGQGTASTDITSLKNRVTTLETDNTTNKQDISSLKSRTTTLETDNETNKTNISILQEDVEEIEGNITELQTEQTAQNKKIEQLDDNQIHITTEKASNINVKDASGQNGKIKLFGISEQKTRSGINLTNYKEWVGLSTKEQITKKADDEIICTITDNSYGVRDIERILEPNTNYTACVDSKFSGNSGSQYGLRVNINGSVTSLKTDGLVNFTTDETGKAEMRYYVGFPYTGANATLTVSNIRLYEGTYTRENIPDYEQYGASPSPEYPSEIENVTGDINIKIYNKNLLDLTKCGFNNCVKNEDGSVRSNINNNYYASIATEELNNFLMKNRGKNITFSFEGISDKIITILINGTRTDSDLGYYEANITSNNITVKIPETFTNITGINFRWNRQNTTFTDTTTVISNIQLELNNAKTDFVEHKEQTITFPLAQNQKMYEGSETEDDGIHHKRKQIELDGTENWQVINENVFYLTLNDIKISSTALMTHFKYTQKILTNLLDNEFTTRAGAGNSIWIKKEEMTLETFKSFLAQQQTVGTPVILEYELETEEIEAYTEEQQTAYNQLQNAKTYKTVTNVFADNAEVEMNYIADTKTYIDNEINSIKEQINTINELLSTTNTSALLLNNLQTDLESEVL